MNQKKTVYTIVMLALCLITLWLFQSIYTDKAAASSDTSQFKETTCTETELIMLQNYSMQTEESEAKKTQRETETTAETIATKIPEPIYIEMEITTESQNTEEYTIPETEDSNEILEASSAQEESVQAYPMSYQDATATITIYQESYCDTIVYAAHVQLSDPSRFGTSCANGVYGGGYETTSQAAARLGGILTVNGCFSASYLNYTVVRDGVLYNGSGRMCYLPGIYSQHTGILSTANGSRTVDELVANGTLTDSFCFGPVFLKDGSIVIANSDDRAQRTFIGTNGASGDLWVCVTNGRYNDGVSAGLTPYECALYLQQKGCTLGMPLDGGGSSTMVFQGQILNQVYGTSEGERAVVDFLYVR